jgi:hypothetical protein
MSGGITLTLAFDGIGSRLLRALRGQDLTKALTRAVKNAGDQTARRLRRDIGDYVLSRKKLKSSTVRKRIRLIRPGAGATLATMEWQVPVSKEGVPLSSYPHRVNKKGVFVTVNKGGGAKRVTRGFVRKGKPGIFRRLGTSSYPIEFLLSSRVVDPLYDRGAMEGLHSKAQVTMTTAFDKTLAAQLAKL